MYKCKDVHEVAEVAVKVYRIIEQKARKGFNARKSKLCKPSTSDPAGAKTKPKGKGTKVDISTSKRQRILEVGTRVRHLAHPGKEGTVTAIDPDTKEVTVEWEK